MSFVIGLLAFLAGIGSIFGAIAFILFVVPQLILLQESVKEQSINPYFPSILLLILGFLNIFIGVRILKKSERRERSLFFYILFIVITVLSVSTIKLLLDPIYGITAQIK